ncbi:cytochrome c oxidase assembly protein COX20, mitochondrial [Chrysoperla carnea]|uniref:cytochrome c oxidase assembly protein COX20, mitochondrial n=1 Tax=Chrysoperla carnea TaxID=189513 RepID=UPI001D07FE6F|nr:cytochrome c oxidase assembly protein COX20, mitochondrial [Chrysoperla carnea]
MDETDNSKSLYLFGRDVSKIPCFRSSFLYGMGGGFGIGLMSFMITSKPRLSTHVGFSGFAVTTLSYWMYCRYRWSLDKFAVTQLQPAMRNKALFEGTKLDPEIKEA